MNGYGQSNTNHRVEYIKLAPNRFELQCGAATVMWDKHHVKGWRCWMKHTVGEEELLDLIAVLGASQEMLRQHANYIYGVQK